MLTVSPWLSVNCVLVVISQMCPRGYQLTVSMCLSAICVLIVICISITNSKHWFTTFFLQGRCRKAMLGVCIHQCLLMVTKSSVSSCLLVKCVFVIISQLFHRGYPSTVSVWLSVNCVLVVVSQLCPHGYQSTVSSWLSVNYVVVVIR